MCIQFMLGNGSMKSFRGNECTCNNGRTVGLFFKEDPICSYLQPVIILPENGGKVCFF
jgi:hypothetical protein